VNAVVDQEQLVDLSILIVCNERSDRRILFDTLDQEQVEAIYSATNMQQAFDFLDQIPISLMIIDLSLEPEKTDSLIERYLQKERSADYGIVAVVPDAGLDERPVSVHEEVTVSLHSPVTSIAVIGLLRSLFREDEVKLAVTLAHHRYSELFGLLDGTQSGSQSEAMTRTVGSALELDAISVLRFTPKSEQKTKVMHEWPHPSDEEDELNLNSHKLLSTILSGNSILIEEAASQEHPSDIYIQKNSPSSYIGIPMVSTRGKILGAIVAIRRKAIEDWDSAVKLIKSYAWCMTREREFSVLRQTARDIGLHDTLTKLPNRLLFNDRLSLAIDDAHRTGELFALLFVDVDRFKTINDSLGHDVGDKVLVAIARRLRKHTRSNDTICRYAGDEFIVILRHIVNKEDVVRIANKVNVILSEPLTVDDSNELQVTASIGISFYPDDGLTGEELLKRADSAMYSAKGMGRNTAHTYINRSDKGEQQKLMLESKLRQAQQNEELRVFYQPKMSVQTEDIVGMEALIRWQHPELGLISPGYFIPLAEETGLIISIGEWLLRRACHMNRKWYDYFHLPLRLGVNLSPLQLRQPNLISIVESALSESGLHPEMLELEITESMSVKSVPGIKECLDELRDLGCSIAIDDFGTGQASLDYLKRFPADTIKIDQSFVRNIGLDPDDEAIINATISMAKSMNLKIVAEGIEQENHREFLTEGGCDELQGYLFSRPLPEESFTRMLQERKEILPDNL